MLLQNCRFPRSHSLVKIEPPVADLISDRNGGGVGRAERENVCLKEREKKKKSKTLIEMGSTLILENVFLTDCSSPVPQGFWLN